MALLGLLDREPSHGYDLKRDYDTYFGRGRPLPYGQVYATLSRLARDGKAIVGRGRARSRADRKRYNITETGRNEVEAWLSEPIPAEPHLQTDLFVKVVLVADARPPGRGVPGRPARRPPAPDARAHRPQAEGNPDRFAPRRPRSVPPRGRPPLDRPHDRSPHRARHGGAHEAPDRLLLMPARGHHHRGAGPRALVRRDPGAARRQPVRAAGRDRGRHGPERIGQVDAAPLPRRHPGPRRRAEVSSTGSASTRCARSSEAGSAETGSASSSSSASSSPS